jgi:hypothetical protein
MMFNDEDDFYVDSEEVSFDELMDDFGYDEYDDLDDFDGLHMCGPEDVGFGYSDEDFDDSDY